MYGYTVLAGRLGGRGTMQPGRGVPAGRRDRSEVIGRRVGADRPRSASRGARVVHREPPTAEALLVLAALRPMALVDCVAR